MHGISFPIELPMIYDFRLSEVVQHLLFGRYIHINMVMIMKWP